MAHKNIYTLFCKKLVSKACSIELFRVRLSEKMCT